MAENGVTVFTQTDTAADPSAKTALYIAIRNEGLPAMNQDYYASFRDELESIKVAKGMFCVTTAREREVRGLHISVRSRSGFEGPGRLVKKIC